MPAPPTVIATGAPVTAVHYSDESVGSSIRSAEWRPGQSPPAGKTLVPRLTWNGS